MNPVNNMVSAQIMAESLAAKQTEKKEEKNNQWNVRKSVNISAASYMMKLANASTTGAVAGILRTARADQAFVKRSGASKKEISKALAIIRRVISSGNRKIAGLKKEQRMENLKRAAKSNDNFDEEERIRKELQKRRKARKARERAEMVDMDQVTIHDHSKDMLCLNEFSVNGLLRDLSEKMSGNEFNIAIGADAGICCADTGETAVVDVIV